MKDGQAKRSEGGPRHDPAAPHTAPFPAHVPRWLAWLLLAAFAVSGLFCASLVLGGRPGAS